MTGTFLTLSVLSEANPLEAFPFIFYYLPGVTPGQHKSTARNHRPAEGHQQYQKEFYTSLWSLKYAAMAQCLMNLKDE